jgi:hypothetical protein
LFLCSIIWDVSRLDRRAIPGRWILIASWTPIYRRDDSKPNTKSCAQNNRLPRSPPESAARLISPAPQANLGVKSGNKRGNMLGRLLEGRVDSSRMDMGWEIVKPRKEKRGRRAGGDRSFFRILSLVFGLMNTYYLGGF